MNTETIIYKKDSLNIFFDTECETIDEIINDVGCDKFCESIDNNELVYLQSIRNKCKKSFDKCPDLKKTLRLDFMKAF
jgi:hypothetical protein